MPAATPFQPRIIERAPRRQGFRYTDEAVAAVEALLNDLTANQVVGIDEPQPTRSKALARAMKMREQIIERGGDEAMLRKTIVPEGEAFVPALYVSDTPAKSKGKK
jgi:hypothetical protein